MQVPENPILFMNRIYKKIFPAVHRELAYWTSRAQNIENSELRKQALASIDSKTFHCEGGGIYAILSPKRYKEVIRFIVAYQTISDYLDNLCDRSTSLDPADFDLLHQSMIDALSPGQPTQNYYRLREDQQDQGYLEDLVKTCQQVVRQIPDYESVVYPYMIKLAQYYRDLQVHKHVKVEERVPRLTKWFEESQNDLKENISWFEFSACAGSTLGIFCLVAYGLNGVLTESLVKRIYQGYFPYMQGLHILLDYYIDQKEDSREGDLNFCSYYDSEEHMRERFLHFIEETQQRVKNLPNERFHRYIQKGLVGMYLADQKVNQLKSSKIMVKALLHACGGISRFFYFNTKFYRKTKKLAHN
ncbi:tetraprenyl-beta-curcumene synthase family protein [Bacillaceae bacterium S4-13-56]